MDFDIFLDLLITRGRINQEAKSYITEAPALHSGISFGFPAASDIDGAITFAPAIRPYNSQTGNWDFSRSYYNISLAFRFKSFVEVKKLPWNYSSTSKAKKELLNEKNYLQKHTRYFLTVTTDGSKGVLWSEGFGLANKKEDRPFNT